MIYPDHYTMKDVAPRLWKAHQQRKRELEERRKRYREAQASMIAGMTQMREGMARLHAASIPASQAFVRLKEAFDGVGTRRKP